MLTTSVGPYSHTCGLAEDGVAYCWGNNWYGDLGNGALESTRRPVRVSGDVRFQLLAAGFQHTCGLGVDGRAFCWGKGSDTGTSSPYVGPPVLVPGGLTFSTLSADVRTCGISLGIGYCWPTFPARAAPVALPGGIVFQAISRNCGLDATGAAWCWRWNNVGSVESGPTRVPGGFSFAALSQGDIHTCAITSDGTAYCWGANAYGELGTDSPVDHSDVPLPVSGGLHFQRIGLGEDHTCALTLNGEAYCWGANSVGQLGNGPDTSSSRKPVRVSGGLVFREIVAGYWYSCGITRDGAAYCWGNNCDGELGDGSPDTCDALHWQFARVPVRVRDP